LRVGPPGPALFYYPNGPGDREAQGTGSGTPAGPERIFGPPNAKPSEHRMRDRQKGNV
jgi:hypothetical protein